MYVYVMMGETDEHHAALAEGLEEKIEQSIGEPCLIIPYSRLTAELVNKISPKALIFSGFNPDIQTYDKEQFRQIDDIVKNADLPILCICGSHQLLSELYSKNIDEVDKFYNYPIRRLADGEDGPRLAGERAEYFTADGFFKITKVQDDPIFEGLNEDMYMRCMHYCEVKELPEDFVLLASSGHARVEAMKHGGAHLIWTAISPRMLQGALFGRLCGAG
ncbi:hypothetical protein FWF93_03210 [Candidatus Saccharibacteria bacterium]|nr:hypothetical protein [Candidatus Saccharibacteria bacterium]